MHKKKTNKIVKFIVLFFFATSFILPIFLTISNSFMKEDEVVISYSAVFRNIDEPSYSGYVADKVDVKLIPDIISLKQYSTILFFSPEYLLKFWNSVILVVPMVFFQIIVSLLCSYFFMRVRKKRTEGLFFLYLLFMLLPFQVTLVPNYLMSKWLGIYDTYLAIILPGVFSTFSVFLLTKFMRRIPIETIEAAKLDGANEWNIFSKIAVPLSKSAIFSTSILLFIEYWNMVEQPVIMLNDIDKYPLSVYLSQINTGEISLAFGVATIYMIPTLLITLFGEEYLIDGIGAYRGTK